MSEVKRQLLKEIEDRIAKRKEAKARAINRNTVEAFVLAFISNVEEINTMVSSPEEWEINVENAMNNLQSQVMSFDNDVRVYVSWHQENDSLPVVNGVTIKWSKAYQAKENCDPELFLDVTELLFN